MPSRKLSGLCAVAAGVVLAGCADQTVLYNSMVRSRYSPVEYGVGAGRKDFRTVIHGDPFDMGQQQFDAATIEVLNRHQPWPQPTHFTTTPGDNASAAHRMVLVFDDPGIPTFRLCREPLPAGGKKPPPGDTLNVSGAFCLRQGVLTAVQGKVRNVEGVDDPKFDALLGQVVLSLFPSSDPNDTDRAFPLVVGVNAE